MGSILRKKVGNGLVALLLLVPSPVMAQSSSSSNYRVDQTFFGTGGETDLNSTNYSARGTAGELGIGETSSANYRAYAGFNTTDEPYLEFVVTGSNIDLGYLDPAQTSTATGTFYVRAWQASGYVVHTQSDPPTYNPGGHQIDPLPTQSGPAVGTEQFGINLVANTSPTSFGAAPVQVPDNTFSFGEADDDYDDANLFKYAKDDIIARSTRSTSVTIYTLSYIFNISEMTANGQYAFNHVLVATATY